MKTYVEFKGSHGPVIVEFDETPVGPLPASRGSGGIRESGEEFAKAVAGVRSIAEALRTQIADLAPTQTSVEFGIKLTTSAGVILASAGGEAHCKITLTWAAAKPGS